VGQPRRLTTFFFIGMLHMYLMGPEPMMSPSTVLLQEEVSFELELIKLHNSTLVSSSKHSLSHYQNYQLNSTQQKPYRKGTQNAMFSYKWNTTNSIRHLNSSYFSISILSLTLQCKPNRFQVRPARQKGRQVAHL
jgi:hypothetical protein